MFHVIKFQIFREKYLFVKAKSINLADLIFFLINGNSKTSSTHKTCIC